LGVKLTEETKKFDGLLDEKMDIEEKLRKTLAKFEELRD
jgi:hypothetical protein